ncbi:MAG TPA: M1 family metallopeptidase [Myxococcaceae bacterium]|nr:M1 family metallopeptidase [Myxococcaceae bacterium]
MNPFGLRASIVPLFPRGRGGRTRRGTRAAPPIHAGRSRHSATPGLPGPLRGPIVRRLTARRPTLRALALALLLLAGCVTPSATPPAPPTPPASAPAPQPPTFRLGDAARPLRYTATLTVDPTSDHFSGEISIDLRLSSKTDVLWLHGRNLDVDRAELTPAGGAPLKATAHPANDHYLGFRLPAPVGPGEARLTVAYRGRISSTDWSGLFREKSGDDWYAFTQFEATEARRVFPCFDEPAFKVPWQLTLKAPRGLLSASNTPIESESDEGPLHVVRFARTRPLPTYLVAFAVGPFERVDLGRWGAGRTPVGALVLKGRSGELQMLKEIAGPGLERLEAWFGIPYAYGKLDFVSIPLFLGAMENPGLITSRAEWVLNKPDAVDPNHTRWVTYGMVHEIAHQWFGDLVTMAWWDDVWLNETFADWLATRVLDDWHPEWERAVHRVAAVRARAMAADSLSSAPAIRQPVASQQEMGTVGGGNYAITYLKGQEVLTMAEGWVGREKFRAGVRRYVAAHQDGNAAAADLFAALGAEANADVVPALSTFIDQAGIPLVSAELRCAAGQAPSLRLSQRRYLRLGLSTDERRWKIPLCARYPGAAGPARACAVMDGAELDLPLPEAKSCPAWVVPNDGALGYYRVSLPPKLWAALMGGAAPLTRAERTNLLGDLFALVSSGDIPMADALAQVGPAVKSGDRYQITLAASFVEELDESIIPDALRPKLARMVREVFGPPARAAGLRPRPKEDDEVKLRRGVLLGTAGRLGGEPALRAEARRLAVAWLADHKAVEHEATGIVLELAAGGDDAALYDQLAGAALKTRDADERRRLFFAMGGTRSPALAQRNLDLLLSGKVDVREAVGPLVQVALEHPEVRELAYAFVKAHFDELLVKLAREEVGDLIVSGVDFCDAAHRQDVVATFTPRAAQVPQGRVRLARTLETIDSCIAIRERQQASAAAFLQKY